MRISEKEINDHREKTERKDNERSEKEKAKKIHKHVCKDCGVIWGDEKGGKMNGGPE